MNQVQQNNDVLEELMLSHVVESESIVYHTTTNLEIKEDFKAELSKAYDEDKTFSRIKAMALTQQGKTDFE